MTKNLQYSGFDSYSEADLIAAEKIRAQFQHTASGTSFYTEREVWREISRLSDVMCDGMDVLFGLEDNKKRDQILGTVEKAGADIQQYLQAARDIQIFIKNENPKAALAGPDLTAVKIADLDCDVIGRMIRLNDSRPPASSAKCDRFPV